MKIVRIQDYGRLVIHRREKYKGTVDEYLVTDIGEMLVVKIPSSGGGYEIKMDRLHCFRMAKWRIRCKSCGITVDNQLDEICLVCGKLKSLKPSCQTCACTEV